MSIPLLSLTYLLRSSTDILSQPSAIYLNYSAVIFLIQSDLTTRLKPDINALNCWVTPFTMMSYIFCFVNLMNSSRFYMFTAMSAPPGISSIDYPILSTLIILGACYSSINCYSDFISLSLEGYSFYYFISTASCKRYMFPSFVFVYIAYMLLFRFKISRFLLEISLLSS